MGKSSQKKAARAAEERNRQQAAENARIQAENERRIQAANERNAQLQREQELLQKRTEWKTGRSSAANKARSAVYDQRMKAIQDSSKLMTDWEVQEKRRLLKAKTGANQTDPEDYAITGDARKRAIAIQKLGEDYWKNKSQVAYDRAWGEYGDFGEGKTPGSISGIRPISLPGFDDTNTGSTGATGAMGSGRTKTKKDLSSLSSLRRPPSSTTPTGSIRPRPAGKNIRNHGSNNSDVKHNEIRR